jgi:hypothetical protein
MSTVLGALLPVLSLILLGFALRKSGLIPREQWRGIEQLCYWLLFPALLIVSISRARLDFAALLPFSAALLLLVVSGTGLMWLFRRPLMRWLGMGGPTWSSLFQTVTRWNGFLAMAIIDKLLGAEGLALLAVAFAMIIPYLNVANVLAIAASVGRTPPTPLSIARELARNPFILGVGLGLAFHFAGGLPGPVETALSLLGRAALGVSLLVVGAGLSWRAVKRAGGGVAASVVLRLAGMPLLALVWGRVLGIEGTALVVLAMTAAVPTAVNGYMLARAMGGDAEYYAAAVTAQVMASVVSLPFFIWLSMWLGGLSPAG